MSDNGRTRVLITDDSIVMRKMINEILDGNGYEIVGEAKNGSEAFEMYKELKPDLVTMDIVMPKEDGLETLKKIMQFDPTARIIIVSGLHQKALLFEAMETGARDYVIKPFEKNELLDVVKKHAS